MKNYGSNRNYRKTTHDDRGQETKWEIPIKMYILWQFADGTLRAESLIGWHVNWDHVRKSNGTVGPAPEMGIFLDVITTSNTGNLKPQKMDGPVANQQDLYWEDSLTVP